MTDIEARVEALEILTAHQDRTIEELHEVISEQWKQLETLKRQLGRLDDQLREVEAGMPAAPIQRPPHY